MSRGETRRAASAAIALSGRETGPASFGAQAPSLARAAAEVRYCASMARLLAGRRTVAVEHLAQFRALGKERP